MTNRTFRRTLGAYVILSILLLFICRERDKKTNAGLRAATQVESFYRQGDSLQNRREKEGLGKAIFYDASLSNPPGQSCATCHRPETSFTDTLHRKVSEGATRGLFSKRNSLSVCYSRYVPPLYYDSQEQTYVGGLFWDGRADSLAHQAGMPFLDLLEMGNLSREMVVEKIRKAPYYRKLLDIYKLRDRRDNRSGPEETDGDLDARKISGNNENTEEESKETTEIIYACVLNALAAYQASDEVNPFASRFDEYLVGRYIMNPAEARGYDVFKNKGMCAECHILEPDPQAGRILFTDHTYDNLGIPRDPENPYYKMPAEHNVLGEKFIDLGLGAIVGKEEENGKFRVPTLRNIENTAPYGHNGYFKTLEDIVHFYNVRDVGNEYPPAEYPQTVNKDELGNLGLTPGEEADLVIFLKMLTDR